MKNKKHRKKIGAYFLVNSFPVIKKSIDTPKYSDILIKRSKLGSLFPFS